MRVRFSGFQGYGVHFMPLCSAHYRVSLLFSVYVSLIICNHLFATNSGGVSCDSLNSVRLTSRPMFCELRCFDVSKICISHVAILSLSLLLLHIPRGFILSPLNHYISLFGADSCCCFPIICVFLKSY